MMMRPWTDRFEKTIRAYLPLLPVDRDVTPDLNLADQGLDSVGTVSLLLALEDAFTLTVPDHMLTADAFATPGGLWAVIESLIEETPIQRSS
ncbi:phosphopantetheine-binding protein [Nocardia carnea]|uniref:phosphopantetheine-binding protein n=1 Tax=Nocardia carnea TaxID=37328 RepID=UPI003D7A56CA